MESIGQEKTKFDNIDASTFRRTLIINAEKLFASTTKLFALNFSQWLDVFVVVYGDGEYKVNPMHTNPFARLFQRIFFFVARH